MSLINRSVLFRYFLPILLTSSALLSPGATLKLHGTMQGAGRHLLGYNTSKIYSPIILNNEWSTLWRMIFMFGTASIGSIINAFFISSFFTEESLRKIGNVYLACVGLADLVITLGVMPTAAFVLITRSWEIVPVCKFLQLLTQGSAYMYNLLFAMVALENYVRLCRARSCYKSFLSIHVALVSVIIIMISFVTSGVGVYFGLDYDYCTRESYGSYTFRFVTSLLLYGLPFVWTVLFLFSTTLVVRARAIRLVNYKRSQQYDRDYAFTNLNFGCYGLFIIAWLPYLVIVNKYPDATDSSFYSCAWLGLSRSAVTSFIYSALNSSFRSAVSRLYYYCCCKTSLNEPFNNRHRRTIVQECTYKRGDVKVHILHNSLAATPKRSGAGCSKDACEI